MQDSSLAEIFLEVAVPYIATDAVSKELMHELVQGIFGHDLASRIFPQGAEGDVVVLNLDSEGKKPGELSGLMVRSQFGDIVGEIASVDFTKEPINQFWGDGRSEEQEVQDLVRYCLETAKKLHESPKLLSEARGVHLN